MWAQEPCSSHVAWGCWGTSEAAESGKCLQNKHVLCAPCIVGAQPMCMEPEPASAWTQKALTKAHQLSWALPSPDLSLRGHTLRLWPQGHGHWESEGVDWARPAETQGLEEGGWAEPSLLAEARPEPGRGQLGLTGSRRQRCVLWSQAGQGSNPASPPYCVARDKPLSSVHCSQLGKGNHDPDASWGGGGIKEHTPSTPGRAPTAAPPRRQPPAPGTFPEACGSPGCCGPGVRQGLLPVTSRASWALQVGGQMLSPVRSPPGSGLSPATAAASFLSL